jgi:hypothetical protein
LSQRAILPSVIVGDSAGISTWVAMAYRNLPRAEPRNAARADALRTMFDE